jgi:dihydrolipoamide dehydrogenase
MDADVVVIGCGPAGFYAARGAARAGLSVVLVEKGPLGGTGLRTGCLPVKVLLDGVRLRQAGAAGPGSRAAARAAPRAWGRALLRRTAGTMAGVECSLGQALGRDGVQVIHAEAELLDPRTVRAGEKSISCSSIVIATGTRAAAPAGIALDGAAIATHAEAVAWREVPRSIVIVGGDVEGIELACLFAHLGSRVHVVERLAEILPGQDRELVQPVESRLSRLGAWFHLGAEAIAARPTRGGAEVMLAGGASVRAEKVLVTGLREPNLPAGLEAAGVAAGPGRIPVDPSCRTSAANVYAVGDINGACGMAHVAIQQGMLVARVLRGGAPGPSAWPSLPRAMFTIPEVAGAGAQARDLDRQGIAYTRSTVALADTWRGISKGVREGFVTLLAAPGGRLLGAWAVGGGAPDIAAPFGAHVDRGATADDLLETLFIHPTMSEALLEAAWCFSTAAWAGRQPRQPGAR